MPLTTAPDAAAALDAIRTQHAAAVHALDDLRLYERLYPRGECLADWAGPAHEAYQGGLAPLLARLAAVRTGLSDAIDELVVVIAQAGDD